MNRKIAFLSNPVSGTIKKSHFKKIIQEEMLPSGIPFEFVDTNAQGSYPELEKRILSDEITDIVVIGGDGTIRSVSAALRHTNARFGIIPAGSGNGLAYAAGISNDTRKAVRIIIEGYSSLIDAFSINNHYSCMLSGIGFDAKVAHQFAASGSRGLTTYLRVVFKNFFSASPYPFKVHFHNKYLSTESYFISVANSNQFGNQFTIAPKAKLNDGLLDIVIVQKMNKFQLLIAIIQQIKSGDIKEDIFKDRSILYTQTDTIEIENPSLAPLHIDGDPFETASKFDIRIIRDAFPLIQPRPKVFVK
jgi:diacylglycerol kinase (ATP)